MSRRSAISVVVVVVVAAAAVTMALELSSTSSNCSEAVCARVVTKCLLTEHCKCNFAGGNADNYTCHRECFGCLADLCHDCCSCFGMCPKTTSGSGPLNRVSSIEELAEPVPQLFEAYTADGGDDQLPPRYTTHTFEQEKSVERRVMRRNCTVAYATKCLSGDECRTTCENMGATFSRWFHDGCCECVGDGCFDYGLAEARCANCPPTTAEQHVDKDDLYYGEDDDDEFFEEVEDRHNNWTTNVTRREEVSTAEWKDPGNRDWDS